MNTNIDEWLAKKLADAEHSVKCRENAAKCWAGGTEEEWNKVSRLSGLKKMTKAERIRESRKELRILSKVEQEVENIKNVISLLSDLRKLAGEWRSTIDINFYIGQYGEALEDCADELEALIQKHGGGEETHG